MGIDMCVWTVDTHVLLCILLFFFVWVGGGGLDEKASPSYNQRAQDKITFFFFFFFFSVSVLIIYVCVSIFSSFLCTVYDDVGRKK